MSYGHRAEHQPRSDRDGQGLILSALGFTPNKDLLIYTGTFYGLDVFNTAFAKAEYTRAITQDLKL